MSEIILLAYATKYGTTREVAEAVAGVMRERGLTVDVKAAHDVKSLEGYCGVMLGAPLYIGSFLKDAQNFLARFEAELVKRPLVVFSLGPLHADPKEAEEVSKQQVKQLAKFPQLKPVLTKIFTGALDPAKLRFPDSLMTKLKASPLYNVPALDERDWPAIRAWAGEAAEVFKPQ